MHGEFGLGSQTKSIKHLSAHNPTISIGSLTATRISTVCATARDLEVLVAAWLEARMFMEGI